MMDAGASIFTEVSLVLRHDMQALARANPAAFQEEAAEAAEAAYRALADRCGVHTGIWGWRWETPVG